MKPLNLMHLLYRVFLVFLKTTVRQYCLCSRGSTVLIGCGFVNWYSSILDLIFLVVCSIVAFCFIVNFHILFRFLFGKQFLMKLLLFQLTRRNSQASMRRACSLLFIGLSGTWDGLSSLRMKFCLNGSTRTPVDWSSYPFFELTFFLCLRKVLCHIFYYLLFTVWPLTWCISPSHIQHVSNSSI